MLGSISAVNPRISPKHQNNQLSFKDTKVDIMKQDSDLQYSESSIKDYTLKTGDILEKTKSPPFKDMPFSWNIYEQGGKTLKPVCQEGPVSIYSTKDSFDLFSSKKPFDILKITTNGLESIEVGEKVRFKDADKDFIKELKKNPYIGLPFTEAGKKNPNVDLLKAHQAS